MSNINTTLAQLRPMSSVFETMIPLVEDFEKNNNIILKCESDYLFFSDSMRKYIRSAFYDGDVYRLDLFGPNNNTDSYTIAVYNVDEKGNKTTLVPSPITEKTHTWVKFRPPTAGTYDIEISGKPNKTTDYYVQYGFIIARVSSDIDDDERILNLVKIGYSTALTLEKDHTEPVHIEINTIVQGQSVEVLRNFNKNRHYTAGAISTADITELQINLYEKQKGKWKVVANGTQYEKTDPSEGDVVYAVISPDSLAEYATVVAGKQFKKGEMSGRCLIFIASDMKPVAADLSSNSPFRPIRGKEYPFKHISTYNDVKGDGKVKMSNGSFEFSSSMTEISINYTDFIKPTKLTFTILGRNYDAKSDVYDFTTSDADGKRYIFTFSNSTKILSQQMDNDASAYRIYIAHKPIYKEFVDKVIRFKRITNSKGQTVRNESGSLIINNSFDDATLYNGASRTSEQMTILQFWYYETTDYKVFFVRMKDSKGKMYRFGITNALRIYNFDTEEYYEND